MEARLNRSYGALSAGTRLLVLDELLKISPMKLF